MRKALLSIQNVVQPLLPLIGIAWLIIHGLTAALPDLRPPDPATAYRAASDVGSGTSALLHEARDRGLSQTNPPKP
jgi:hypothetical protein